MEFIYNTGGREEAGFKGSADDCVARAIAIATGKPYREVYDDLAARCKAIGKPRSARNRIPNKIVREYLAHLGWKWTPTMQIGSGCRVHLKADELPKGRIICNLSKHVVAVIDGTVHDTHDPTRNGKRCVYGYWRLHNDI